MIQISFLLMLSIQSVYTTPWDEWGGDKNVSVSWSHQVTWSKMKYITRQCGARTWHCACYWRLEHKSQLLKAENTDWADGIVQHSTALGTSPNKSFSSFCPCCEWHSKNRGLCAPLVVTWSKTRTKNMIFNLFRVPPTDFVCVQRWKNKQNTGKRNV